MERSTLAGSRIRETRLSRGIKQADLAAQVGVSGSYLNLIEHNRRNIGGKLLMEIARALGADASVLARGAEDVMLDTLREAAARQSEGPARGRAAPETERIEDFVSRFPGWAALLAEERRRAQRLERTVEVLSDRLTHDPQLSASLHEVLSAVTSVRSTAAILADETALDPTWRGRFEKNLDADSRRLADSAQALVAYLDNAGNADTGQSSPQERWEAWLAERQFHLPELEDGGAPGVLLRDPALRPADVQALAAAHMARYRADALVMPLAEFGAVARETGWDPAALAARFEVALPAVFRRIATLPEREMAGVRAGIVICDGAGAVTFCKPLDGFAPPRHGAGCPLWPLYQALGRPMAPLRAVLLPAGRVQQRLLAYAVSEAHQAEGFGSALVHESSMLLLSGGPSAVVADPPQSVGMTCRICPRADCPARREPSILEAGL